MKTKSIVCLVLLYIVSACQAAQTDPTPEAEAQRQAKVSEMLRVFLEPLEEYLVLDEKRTHAARALFHMVESDPQMAEKIAVALRELGARNRLNADLLQAIIRLKGTSDSVEPFLDYLISEFLANRQQLRTYGVLLSRSEKDDRGAQDLWRLVEIRMFTTLVDYTSSLVALGTKSALEKLIELYQEAEEYPLGKWLDEKGLTIIRENIVHAICNMDKIAAKKFLANRMLIAKLDARETIGIRLGLSLLGDRDSDRW